jgi:hypothetical protein
MRAFLDSIAKSPAVSFRRCARSHRQELAKPNLMRMVKTSRRRRESTFSGHCGCGREGRSRGNPDSRSQINERAARNFSTDG